jgi:hypothetical protein
MTNCRCESPGYCDLLKRPMIGRIHQLCRTDRRYHRLFRQQAGLPLEETPLPSSRVSCQLAGPDLGHVSTPLGLLPILGCKIHDETTPAHCDHCPDCIEGQPKGPLMTDFLPIIGKGLRIKEWAVGIVTAPREEPTLERCGKSLIAAGWDSPRLFAEPGTEIPADLQHLPRTQRDVKANAWGNWYLALHELMTRQPKADAYMVCQDDTLFASGDSSQTLREYLERALWPDEETGVVSIYCSSAYANNGHGWILRQGKWVWGALAFIWPRESLRHFLATQGAEWTAQERERKVDIAVGFWQQNYGKSVYFSSPSLTQHIGDVSTIWGRGNKASGRRAAKEFVGDMV